MGQLSKGLPLQNKKMTTPIRNNTSQKNAAHPALGEKAKVYLAPLHMKLGLIKISVKAMDKQGEGFAYSREKFPIISVAKKEFSSFHKLHNYL